jgi:hypothetical protein
LGGNNHWYTQPAKRLSFTQVSSVKPLGKAPENLFQVLHGIIRGGRNGTEKVSLPPSEKKGVRPYISHSPFTKPALILK